MFSYKYLLLLLFFVFPLLLSAQDDKSSFELAIGEPMNNSERKSLGNIVGRFDNGFVVLQKKMKRSFGFTRREPYQLYLQFFNNELEAVKEERLKFSKDGQRLTFRFIVQLKERLFLFASATDKKGDKESLMAVPLNTESLQPVGEWIQLAEVENEKKDGYFSWSRSKDKSKLLLLFSSFSDRLDRQNYSLFVFDQELASLWQKENCLPYPLKRFSIVQYHLDNEGNVYLLNTLFGKGGKDRSDYQYHLLAYKNAGNELHQYGIELPGRMLTEIKVTTDDELNLIGGGFYANAAGEAVKGAYSFQIDGKKNEVISTSNEDFDAGMVPPSFESQSLAGLEQFSGIPSGGAHQLRRSGFELKDIILRKDGSALLLGEKYLVTTSTLLDKGISGTKTETSYFYRYQDVLLVSISREGEIEWVKKVGKQQYSQNDRGLYGSCLVSQYQDQLYLLFNNYSFLESKGKGGRMPVMRSEAVLVRVDRQGNQQKELIGELDHQRLTLIPRSGMETGEGSLVLLGGNEENHSFIHFSLKNINILSLR